MYFYISDLINFKKKKIQINYQLNNNFFLFLSSFFSYDFFLIDFLSELFIYFIILHALLLI